MIGLLIAYAAGKSVQRSRQRRFREPEGYGQFEFTVILTALAIGTVWPFHLGFVLTKWGLHMGWSITIATIAGFIGLATGAGYIVIGMIYAGIWLAVLIAQGVDQDNAAMDCPCNHHCECD